MFGKIQTLEHLFQPGLSPAFPPTPPPPSASGIAFSLISPTPIPTPSRLWFLSSLGNRVLFSKLSEISPKQDTREGLCLFFTEGWERSSFIAKYGALKAKYEGFLGVVLPGVCHRRLRAPLSLSPAFILEKILLSFAPRNTARPSPEGSSGARLLHPGFIPSTPGIPCPLGARGGGERRLRVVQGGEPAREDWEPQMPAGR